MIMNKSMHRAEVIRWGVALLVFISATVALLYGPSRIEYPAPLLVLHASSVFDSLILAATFYASIGLVIGRRSAWRAGILVLIVAAVWESIEVRETISAISLVPFAALIALALTRRYYPIASHNSVIRRTLQRAVIFTAASTVIGCLAFFILASIEHRHFSIGASIIRALDAMYSLQDAFRPMQHPTASRIIGRSFLLLLGVINYIIIALALLRPVADNFHLTPLGHARALHFLRRFGTSSEDFFKYFPADKSYYFGQAVEGVVAYGLHEGICVALADPIAESFRTRQALLDEFLNYTRSRGWHTIFLAVENDHLALYERPDLHSLKIGEAARLPLSSLPELLRSKNNRNIMNRFAKGGYTAKLYQPRHASSLLEELRAVSDAWLGESGRSERQFAMGAFEPDYLQRSRLFVVRDSNGNAIAFANLHPNFSHQDQRASIDLMRLHPDAPSNTMDFLFLSLMSQLRSEGWHEFDLGLAPLSGLAQGQASERSLHLLYQYSERWFAFRGLRRFKEKFKPVWQPVFIVYTGSSSRLAAMGLAVNELMKYRR